MTPGRHAARPRGALRRLMALLRPEWARLTVVAVFTALSVGFLVAGPQILGHATNILFDGIIGQLLPAGSTKAQAVAGLRARGHSQLADMYAAMNLTPGTGVNLNLLGRVLAVAAAVYALSAFFNWAQGYIMAGIAQRTVHRLRQAVDEKLDRLPLRYFDSHPHGDILSRVTNDIDNINTTLTEALSQLPTSVLTVLAVLGVMFWVSPLLAAVSLVTVPVVTAVTFMIAIRSKAPFAAQWERTGQLNSLVEETYTGHALVLAYGRRQPLAREFARQNDQLREASFRAQFLSGVILPAVLFVGNLNYVAITALGGYQVATGLISLGSVQAFIQYSRRFTTPITQIAGQMNLLQSGLASADRVFDFLDAREEPVLPAAARTAPAPEAPALEAPALEAPALEALAPEAPAVRLEGVSFRYDPDTPLIEDFTLAAAPGETIAIVGPTGAGKTTVVNLLMRFYEIDRGRILLGGADYRNLSRDEVRRCFSMVLQDTWLFSGTVRENIAYGREGATDADIVAAARAAHVDDFVSALPDGYATVLDGDASGISAGQKQLLTIARAFLANRSILILDEATSNVDTRTEALIQDAMTRLRAGRTSFVIAHRLSTIRDADTIVVMDGGRVVEQGSHADLLSRRGFYHELYNSQFAEAVAP